MRFLFISFFFFATAAYGQVDTSNAPANLPDTFLTRDTLPQLNSPYGKLLDDDPEYNKRYPVWIPSARVFMANTANWAAARYIYKFEWAKISPQTWKDNLKSKWVWDVDGFGLNFIGHPHTGNYYHNIARSNGYTFWQSLPFNIQGSLTWELFGENEKPSYNDFINTPLSGMFLGEVFYRISSNILNDQKRGRQRVMRELLAGIVNPPRALNRLTQGKMWRVTDKEVYQKEPLNITLNAGVHRINENNKFATGSTNAVLNSQFDYGSPFEVRKRKPFDIFRFRVELSYGEQRRFLENVNGYGNLFGRTVKKDRLFAGGFQHFDYWNNSVFTVGALGYGGGLIGKIPISNSSNLFSAIHLAVVPLAGVSDRIGPDSSEYRIYDYGGGLQAKIEERLILNKWATIGITGFYYWIHSYEGKTANSLVGIIRPTLNIKLFKNLSLGFEQHIYQNDRYIKGLPNVHLTRTEQKLTLQLFIQDRDRSGKYH